MKISITNNGIVPSHTVLYICRKCKKHIRVQKFRKLFLLNLMCPVRCPECRAICMPDKTIIH